MAQWVSTVISVKSEQNLSKEMVGVISDGIVIHRLDDVDRFWIKEEDRRALRPTKLVLSIRLDLIEGRTKRITKNAYATLLFRVLAFLRIFVHPGIFHIRVDMIDSFTFEYDKIPTKKQAWSRWWDAYLEYSVENAMALRLFDISTHKDLYHPMIKVMYSTIALESVLLKGEKSESSYKFRMRGAFLLGKEDTKKRREYYEILKYAYEIRSAVAHSNDKQRRLLRKKVKDYLKLDMKKFNDRLVKASENLIKESIMNAKILDEVDEHILGI